MKLDALAIFCRWLHVISACVLIGSVYFHQVLLPVAKQALEADAREIAERRLRRGLKLTVHMTLLMFLISGAYNAWRNWPIYTMRPGLMHAMFGMHLLLGLGAITLLMMALAGRESRPQRAGWAKWALVMLVLGVAAASTLKSAREWTLANSRATDQK